MTHAATARAQSPEETFATLRRTRPIKFILVFILIVSVWFFARFGGEPGAGGAAAFSRPEAFVATPGGSARHIHVRAGPGAEFEIRESLDRGTIVSGIARKMDSANQSWIWLRTQRALDRLHPRKEAFLNLIRVGGRARRS